MSTANGHANGTPRAGAHAGTPPAGDARPTDRARELRRRLSEARLEARTLAAERMLRRVKESQLDWDWVGPWHELLDRRTRDGWFPLGMGTPSARRYGVNFPFYQSEQEHAIIRDLARVVVGTNNHAWGMLRGLRSFVIRTGHKFKVTGRLADQKAGTAAAKRVTAFLDVWAKRTRWYERQREIFWRTHRDGDGILRTFADDGWLKLRFAWPEQMVQPPGTDFHEWGFGVKCDPEDAETVEGYYFAKVANPAEGEEVDPAAVHHFKANVDAGIKRGLSDFSFGTKDVLDAAARLTKNLGEGSAVRAAIAYMRQHAGATEDEVQEFVAAGRTYQERVPFRDTYRDVTDMPPGSVVDFSEGMEHAGAPVDPGTEGHASVVAILLRSAGTRWNAPEWLVSGDASNMGAYTSSLVAESPFVGAVVESQDYYQTRFLEVVDAALACAAAHGLVGREDLDAVVVDLVAPTPEVRDKDKESARAAAEIPLGVQSRQGYCSEQGRDFDQIAADNQEYQQRFGDPMPTLPGPGTDQPPPGAGGGGAGGATPFGSRPESLRESRGLREEAPGPPPRPGLVWNDSTSRWRNPETGDEHGHGGAGGAHAGTPDAHPLAQESPPAAAVDGVVAGSLPGGAPAGLVAKVREKVAKVMTRLAVLAYDAALHSPQILDAVGLVADTPEDMGKIGYNPATAGNEAHHVADLKDFGSPLTTYQTVNLVTKLLPAAIAWVKSKLGGKAEGLAESEGMTPADLLAAMLAVLAEEFGLPAAPTAGRVAELLRK